LSTQVQLSSFKYFSNHVTCSAERWYAEPSG